MRWRALLFAWLMVLGGCTTPPDPAEHQVVVLGFDGMDPALVERWMDEGKLPEFARLRAEGTYRRLGTTNPPQSSVAWAGFATGHNAGAHGIFDFLRRDPKTYMPDFSMVETVAAPDMWDVFGYQIPVSDPEVRGRRQGEPFWLAAERAHQRATVLRVPVTYPPDPVTHMLSGLGVPDLLGTQGTYTLYTTRRVPGAENGGRVKLLRINPDGPIETDIEGPTHPLDPAAGALTLPMSIVAADNGVDLDVDGENVHLETGQWSDWVPLEFNFVGVMDVRGMVRFHLNQALPALSLYMSPIEFDPRAPAAPISAPPEYAAALAERIGRYHTLGMPEETWALNQGHLGDDAWLDVVRGTLAEGEAMLYDALDRRDTELVIKVFVQTDRVSHMFWRGIDSAHPLHATTGARGRGAIEWIYREADRIVGEARRRMRPGDRLIIVSDHGFAPFRTAVNVNRWLIEQGYLALRSGATQSAPLFAEVDWSRTRAYALGLNGLYINLSGREAHGIVAPDDVAALKQELIARLTALRDASDTVAVLRVYDGAEVFVGPYTRDAPDLLIGYAPGFRASWQTALGGAPLGVFEANAQPWSGDHCIAPEAVPGVFFSDVANDVVPERIDTMAPIILRALPSP
jgi:predicted AlkP superfamily phosphohydrolase/phosphomutase